MAQGRAGLLRAVWRAVMVASVMVERLDASAATPQLVEVFEVEARGERWEFVAFTNGMGGSVEMGPGLRNEPPSGWDWATDWILDGSYGGLDGWTYAQVDGWSGPSSRPARRRRWVRVLSPKVGSRVAEVAEVEEAVAPGVGLGALAKRGAASGAASALARVRDDFTFRGFGIGLSRATWGWDSRRTAGFVLQLPITPNFASWERRRFLPMITMLLVAYPPSEAHAALVVAIVFSVSYPLDTLRRGLEAVASPLRGQPRQRQRPRVRLGARSVQRVGFSVASRVELDAFRLSVSAVQLRPWYMYAPGLRLVATLVDTSLAALANLTLRTLPDAAPVLRGALNNSTTAVNSTTADAALDADRDATARNATAGNGTALNATASSRNETNAAKKTLLIRRRGARKVRGPLAAISRAIDASRTFKAWWDSKTSLLGYSFLPIDADLLHKSHERRSLPFKPWRGSLIFMMRPFFPIFPKL